MTMITSIVISTYMITFLFSMSKEDHSDTLRQLELGKKHASWGGVGLITRI